jgi:hypothetical protein
MAGENGTGAAKRKTRLEREPGTVRPRARGRLERAEGAVDEGEERRATGDDRDDDLRSPSRDRGRGRRGGRPPLAGEIGDINRSVAFVGIEAAAIAMDVVSRVLRGAIDRALDEDYTEPGDLVRGLGNEADMAAYDLVDEMRQVPRRLSHRFESSLRSPRADRGERARRAADAATPADSPEAREERREPRPEARRRPD